MLGCVEVLGSSLGLQHWDIVGFRGYEALPIYNGYYCNVVLPQDKRSADGWCDYKFEVVVKRSTSRK